MIIINHKLMPADLKTWADGLLKPAGIALNGPHPWDPQIHNQALYSRVSAQGSLGLGEAYMDGWWDCAALDEFFYRLLSFRIDEKIGWSWPVIWGGVKSIIINPQSVWRAFQVGEAHYDLGNDLFEAMLDKRLAYSCGYWREADNLDAAQEAKLDLICRKLGLQTGQKILDIGCGWGSLIKYAAQKYGASAVGITVSKEQAKLAQESCAGLPVEIRVEDYRKLNEKFDHLASVGMIEHVGSKNYRVYMETARRCLKDDGLFLLHTIGSLKSSHGTDPWLDKYIFPNGQLPSLKQLSAAIEGLFVIEDIHNFGADYDKTLLAWHANFEAAWPRLQAKYGERFHRMWNYYLLCCAGTCRSRMNQLWQLVLSPRGVPGGYKSIR